MVIGGFKEHWIIKKYRGEWCWYFLNVHGNYERKGPVSRVHGPLKYVRGRR